MEEILAMFVGDILLEFIHHQKCKKMSRLCSLNNTWVRFSKMHLISKFLRSCSVLFEFAMLKSLHSCVLPMPARLYWVLICWVLSYAWSDFKIVLLNVLSVAIHGVVGCFTSEYYVPFYFYFVDTTKLVLVHLPVQ
jgi:hypothetical protein